jgi:hypothetical protein
MHQPTGAMSHKLFSHVSYAWSGNDCHSWAPFLGSGFEIEWGGHHDSSSNTAEHRTLSQWEIWVKGGIAFD